MASIDLIGNSRHIQIFSKLKTIIFDLAGSDLAELDHVATFLELGFDSLFLIQMSTSMKSALGVEISFRQLIEETDTFQGLVHYLDEQLPENHDIFNQRETSQPTCEDVTEVVPVQASINEENSNNFPTSISLPSTDENNSVTATLISQQLELMSHQLEVLRQHDNGIPQALEHCSQPIKQNVGQALSKLSAPGKVEQKNPSDRDSKPFGAIARITREKTEDLSPFQQQWLDDFIHRYNERTTGSKEYAQLHRPHMADPRVVTGFKSKIKDLIYPIVVNRTDGCHIWDVDGNDYVDALNGFGSNFFGYRHPKITQAVVDQLWRGADIGPQSSIVGGLAKIICNFTGLERTAFCNTGSEAVMGAMRMARTVTGRSLIAIFNGSYHGIFDEVLVRGTKNLRSVPAAPGILPSSVENVLVLDYGTDETLKILRERASELAAVMVEPIQSRRPEFRPREFLHAVREITEESGTAFIFDEVVTGFRLGPGGAQQYFGIQADIATYGKIIGGGMPIGVMAGKARFMDALDGGAWSYGDDSVPEVGVTYFAGTFVRHPAAMAACQAAMEILHDGGQEIYSRLTDQTTCLGSAINNYCEQVGAPLKVEWFSSLFRITPTEHMPYGELLFYLMRQKGVHIYDGFPCFLTMAHTDADVDHIIRACQESIRELQDVGLLPTLSKTGMIQQKNGVASSPSSEGGKKTEADVGQRQKDKPKNDKANKEISKVRSSSDSSSGQRFPLTEAQMEIWLASHMSDIASCAYNEPFMLSLFGPLNLEVLEKAIQEVLCRHDALHLRFERNEPFQTQGVPERIPQLFLDLSLFDAITQQSKLVDIFSKFGSTAFNLLDGPLVRVQIIRLHTEDHRVVCSSHHIICDGWSWNTMLREIGVVYSAMVQHSPYQLPIAEEFRSYVENEIQAQKSNKAERAYSYWMNEFKELPAPLALPIDRKRMGTKTYTGATVTHIFDQNLYRSVKQSAMRQKASLFSMTFAAFNILLARLANQSDVVVTVPTAGQLVAGVETLVGHCVNILPVRAYVDPAMSFQEFLSATTRKILEVYDHQDCTLGGIIKRLQIPRDPSRLPLVEVNFNLDRDGAAMQFYGLDATVEQTPKQVVHFDLFFNLNEVDGQLRVDLDYNSDLFDETTIQRWLTSYASLLESIVATPEQPIGQLALLSQEERQQLLVEWNQTGQARDPGVCLHELFETQVAVTSRAVAVVYGEQQLTYEELNHQANQVAHYLRKNGVIPEMLVGLYMERSLDMIIGLLGILKTGGAYVPLDPIYPPERLAFILEDTEAPIVVTQASLREQLPKEQAIQAVCLDRERTAIEKEPGDNLNLAVTDANLAYVIYTSGSTGKPKGVMVTHANVSRLFQTTHDWFGFNENDVWTLFHSSAFDFSVWEIWGAWLYGGRLVVVPYWVSRSPEKFYDLILREKVTILNQTPTAFTQLIQVDQRKEKSQDLPLRLVIFGGEKLAFHQLMPWMDRYGDESPQLVNMYGITETTVHVTYRPILAEDCRSSSGKSVIGRPLPDLQFYLLDQHRQLVPIGVPGEIYVGGGGIARGYLNRPELTRERFIKNPFSGDSLSILYKSGDLAKRLPNGDIEFLGRSDHQVKIRGFRIELGEVESMMSQHPDVYETVVVAKEAPFEEKRLVAYLVGKNQAKLSIADLRNYLSATLPTYMVPSSFVWLEALPLTPNGKIDRARLPADEALLPEVTETYVAPRNPLESKLATIWEEVLKKNPIGIHSNFFDLGGHSLKAFQVFSMIEKKFGKVLPLSILFEAPTIEQLGAYITNGQGDRSWTSLVPIQPNGSKAPLFLVHGLGGNVLTFANLVQILGQEQPLYGLQSAGLTREEKLCDRIEDMAAFYIEEIRFVQPQGPYYLGGACMGGLVAFEVAQQLQGKGQKVAFLGLFDTWLPNHSEFNPYSMPRIRFLEGRLQSQIEVLKKVGIKAWIPQALGKLKAIPEMIQEGDVYKKGDKVEKTRALVTAANFRAVKKYVPTLYKGKIAYFEALARDVDPKEDTRMEWEKFASEGFECFHISASNSGDMFEFPAVKEVASQIKFCLEQVLIEDAIS